MMFRSLGLTDTTAHEAMAQAAYETTYEKTGCSKTAKEAYDAAMKTASIDPEDGADAAS